MIKKLIVVTSGVLALVMASASAISIASDVTPAETVFTTMEIQGSAPWGLDIIDGNSDGSYTYLSTGSNTRVYVVDTGVDATHPDFGSRVVSGFDAFGAGLDRTDCQGHGTHVAGVIAGTTFGVAKKATIVPIRVLNCTGQGNTSTLTAGIDWILANHPAGTTGIVNMSLGGPKDVAVNRATERLIAAGMSVVVAAGNSNVDACTFSPASAQGVIAVGSIDNTLTKSAFSNWGSCVDIFAPGSRISSDSPFNHSAVVQKSGTSQASPFVAGILATYLSADLKSSSTALQSKLLKLAKYAAVLNSNSANNNLALVETANSPIIVDIPIAQPEPVAPTDPLPSPATGTPNISVPSVDASVLGVNIAGVTPKSATVVWESVSNATGYSVRVGLAGSRAYSYVKNSKANKVTIDGLRSNVKYWVTVIPYTKTANLKSSNSVEFTTPYGIASAPTQVSLKLDRLSWKSPLYLGGESLPIYKVELLVDGVWTLYTTTTKYLVNIIPPKAGKSDTYRVRTLTPAGASAPSEELVSIGSNLPQVYTPVPDLPVDLAGSLTVEQLGAGSPFAKLSWSALTAGDTYKIQRSGQGVDAWVTIASTTANYRVVAINPGTTYLIRVVSSSGSVLGVIQYLGM